MIQANIRASGQGELVKTDAYLRLDPSEKSAVSYFLGLTLTKVAAHRFFGVPWLLHVDVYADDLDLLKVGHFTPDLVGEDNLGRWHVLEAKGRSHGLDNQMILRAKTQTAGLGRICGLQPYLRVASLAYFSGRTLCLHLEDPEEVDRRAIDFHPRGGENGFLRNYYEPFVHILSFDDPRFPGREIEIAGRRVRVLDFVDADLTIGLDTAVQKSLHAKSIRRTLHEYLGPFSARPPEVHGDTFASGFIGPDGVFVGLGNRWSPRQ